MKKKEVLILIGIVLVFCTGAFSLMTKTISKAASTISSVAFSKAGRGEIVEDTVDLAKFKELKIDVASMNVYVEQGDDYKLEYRVYEDYIPKVEEKGDELEIRQPSHNGIVFHLGSWFDEEEQYYKLTVPKDAGALDVDLEASSGLISVENIDMAGKIEISSGEVKLDNIEGEKLKLKASSGDINLENLNVDELDFKLTSGDLKAYKCDTKALDAHMTSGNMGLDEIKFDSANFKMTSGKIDAHVVGNSKDYSYDLRSTSGDMRVDGKTYDHDFKSGDDKDNRISVDMTSGDLDISFSN